MAMHMNTLNEFYRAACGGAPVCYIPLTPEIGEGFMARTTTPQSMSLADWRMKYEKSMPVNGAAGSDLRILYCRGRGVEWRSGGHPGTICLDRGQFCIGMEDGAMESMCYEAGEDYAFQSVRVPRERWLALLAEYLPEKNETARQMLFAGEMNVFPATASLRLLWDRLQLDQTYADALSGLRRDGLLLELLADCVKRMIGEEIPAKKISISRDNQEAILTVKQRIDNNPGKASSLTMLARAVHMSESVLTKGFRQMFGCSVHAYAIERRLELAAQYLSESDMNVTEAAALAGYAKPSQFAAAFRNKYGCAPRKFREKK